MSLFAEYYKSRLNYDTIETEDGFIVYRIEGEECHIKEFYIKPEARKGGGAMKLINLAIQKEADLGNTKNLKFLSCGIAVKSSMASEALAHNLYLGFKLESAHNDYIVLVKEL